MEINSTCKTLGILMVFSTAGKSYTYLWGFYPSGKYGKGATHKMGGQIHTGGNFESAEQHAYFTHFELTLLKEHISTARTILLCARRSSIYMILQRSGPSFSFSTSDLAQTHMYAE